jgi:hypothetical protein
LYEVARRHSPTDRASPKTNPRNVDRPTEPPAPSAPPVAPPRPVSAAPPPVATESRVVGAVLASGPIRSSPVPSNAMWGTGNRGPLIVVGTAGAIVMMFIVFALVQRFAGAPENPPQAAPAVALAGDTIDSGETRLADDEQTVDAPERASGAAPLPARPTAPTVELRRGYDYVFVQYFPRSKRTTAEKVAIFLQGRGIPCAMYMGAQDIRLIATEPFLTAQDDAKAAAAQRARSDELIRKIKQLGRQYKPEQYDLGDAALKPIR